MPREGARLQSSGQGGDGEVPRAGECEVVTGVRSIAPKVALGDLQGGPGADGLFPGGLFAGDQPLQGVEKGAVLGEGVARKPQEKHAAQDRAGQGVERGKVEATDQGRGPMELFLGELRDKMVVLAN